MKNKKEKSKWNWKLILLGILIGFLVGKTIRWVTDDRCEFALWAYGHGFSIEVTGYQCSYLDEKCENYAKEGYACELRIYKNPSFFEKDYICNCQLRYSEFTRLTDWRLE